VNKLEAAFEVGNVCLRRRKKSQSGDLLDASGVSLSPQGDSADPG
jgi:hypothetical protein